MHIHYTFSLEDAQQHLININVQFKNLNKGRVDMILPAWRPGRYERANYAENIKDFKAESRARKLKFKKTERNTWTIDNCPEGEVNVSYKYFANTINAGSSYIDQDQLYVNPVNCCMHVAGEMSSKVTAELKVPAKYKSSGMLKVTKQKMKAKDLDDWYDSPFVSSASLIQHRFKSNGINFEIAVQGDVPYVKEQIESDFRKFIDVQMKAFKDCPVNRYTFLVQATPHRHYHGVEHEWGTTITLGPSRSLLNGSVYEDLLAVCSHELYHTWNVKYMRPKEMWPYDFTKENYHRAGYIIEGVTTYQGDLKLWQAGVMTDETFLKELKTHLDRHVANYGRMNLSVRESSFDTWIDGYGKSIPDRKVSIYTEGALISMLFDIAIMNKTRAKKSLDTVMTSLYDHCKEKGRGYAESDYLSRIYDIIPAEGKRIFKSYADKAVGYEREVYRALRSAGVKVKRIPIDKLASHFGIRTDSNSQPKIIGVHPQSEANKKGIRVGMQIIGLDGLAVEGDAEDLITRNELWLMAKEGKKLRPFDLKASKEMLYVQHELEFDTKKNALWRKWKKGVF
ncbi:MAG: M61 family metallopeptidase [Flavobacteriales bacterium]|nr:M61 family metallopeptidase [Flavobacteriales bacterium]NNK80244.1 M61 family metallopeptidase [Flavobacteriales bacterium]